MARWPAEDYKFFFPSEIEIAAEEMEVDPPLTDQEIEELGEELKNEFEGQIGEWLSELAHEAVDGYIDRRPEIEEEE